MPAHLTKVGAAYYFRPVAPEHLQPFFRTRTGKSRAEFMESLGVKERRVGESAKTVDDLRAAFSRLREQKISEYTVWYESGQGAPR